MSLRHVLASSSVAAVVIGMLAVATPAHAATVYHWTNDGTTTSWSDSRNWTPIGVPGNGDSVVIESPNDNQCATHVTGAPAGVDLYDFTMDETAYLGNPESPCLSSVTGGSITVEHQFTFHAGTIDSPLTLAAGATGVISPNVVDDTTTISAAMVVHGALTLANDVGSHRTSLSGSPSVTIASDGSLTTQSNVDLSANCCIDNTRLINQGTISVAASTTLHVSGVELDQDATVNVPGRSQLVTDTAPQTAGPGAVYSGAGTWNMQFGEITATGRQNLAKGFHWVLGGHGTTGQEILGGTFNLAGSGTFEWAGGRIEANLALGKGITAFANGPAGADPRQLYGTDTTTSPRTSLAVTLHDPFSFTNGAGLDGLDGGQLVVSSDGSLSLASGTVLDGDATVVNSGGLVSIPATTAGATAVQFSDGQYRATGGTTSIGTNATLSLQGDGPATLTTTTVSGGGTLSVTSPVTLSGTTTVGDATTLALQYHGSLTSKNTSTATLGGTGAFTWTGGDLVGKLAIATSGGQSLSGTDHQKHVSVPVGVSSTSVTFAGPTSIAAGTGGDDDQLVTDQHGSVTFAGATTIGGAVDLVGGKLAANGATTVQADGSEVDVVGDATLTSSGILTVAAGTLESDDPITLAAGTLAGLGTVQADVVNTAAAVAPGGTGSVGTLTITGNYSAKAGASLLADVASGGADLLAVTGNATLNGTLVGNDLGWTPPTGAKATVLTAMKIVNKLQCVSTTGDGATTHHWKAGVPGATAVVLTSLAGAATSCG